MKKYTPYILPLIVVFIIGFLGYRWYINRRPTAEISHQALSIKNLTNKEKSDLLKGVKDYQQTQLRPENKRNNAIGDVRYLIEQGRFKFSLTANLPETGKTYFVWLHPLNTDKIEKVGQLTAHKGGLLESGSISADVLPAEMIISTEQNPTKVMHSIILRAVIDNTSRGK